MRPDEGTLGAAKGAKENPALGGRRQGRSLVWHLSVFAAGVVAPIFIFFTVLMWQVASSERARHEEALQASASAVAALVDRELSGLVATTRALAADPILAAPLPSPAELDAFEGRARPVLPESTAEIALVAPSGAILAVAGGELPSTEAELLSAQVRDMIVGGQNVSNLMAEPGDATTIAVRAVVPGHPDGASLVVLIPAERVLRAAQGVLTTPGRHAAVFDRTGRLVAWAGAAEVGIRVARLSDLAPAVIDTAFATTLDGEAMIAGVVRIAGVNWTALALAPRAVVTGPILRTLTALALLGLAIFAIVALLTLGFGRRAAGVAHSLRSAAAQIGRGEAPRFAMTPIRDVNEVGEALVAAGIGLREREAALRDNAAYLRRVLDNLSVFVAVLDTKGVLTEVNAAPLRLTGLAREDLVGRSFWDLPWWSADPQARAKVREAVVAAREGRISRFDVGARIREGVEIIVDLQLAPLRDANGKITAIIPSAIDVSEREQATRDLRENAERLRLALLAGRLGAWDLDVAADVCIYSERTQEMFGLATPRLSRSEFQAIVHPEDRPAVAQAVSDAIEKDAPYSTEFRVIRPDGETRWIASQALVQRDEYGAAVRLIGVHQDISPRRAREEELRSNIELLRIIGETTPDLIVVKDAQGRYRFVNPAMARILGRSQSALVGATSLDGALDPQEAALLHANDLRIMDEARSQTVEESITVPGGAKRIFLSTKTPMRDRLGAVTGLVGVSTDITDRKRAEERQALMVRELHHRVKNSLATVQAIANSTARTATDIESFREAFNQRVISLARTHTLLAENSWGVIPLRELLVAELEPYGGGDSMRVSMSGPEVALPSDVALSLGMAIHELTTNALKYGALSSPEGAVAIAWSVETAENSRRLRLSWKETGGPEVVAPSRQGFGSRLLRHMLGGQFSGDVQMSFEPDGLRFSVTVPLVERAEAPVQAAQ